MGVGVFLCLMVIGLIGLLFMAVPALGGHRHAQLGQTRASAHPTGHHPLANGRPGSAILATHEEGAPAVRRTRWLRALRWLPSPRAVCSVLALYGAFGNALLRAAHLRPAAAALVAILPTVLVEWLAVRPIWNFISRSQAAPASPLEMLVLAEAQAVTPFRNGRGLVSITRDGRHVQLAARLSAHQQHLPVIVGQRLQVEDVDAANERLTVSVLPPSPDHLAKGTEA